MSYILETKDARFAYETGESALSGVSVRIAEGKKTVLLGPNGSGKSTLFLHMNGVLRPQKGEVLFRGEPLRYDRANIASLRQKVCLMFQNPDDQIFAATVEEDVAFGPMNLKLPPAVVEKRVDEALCAVDMQKYRSRPTQQLSYGQRKRVAMAGALAMEPEALLMDEPTAGLDVQMVREMLEFSDELSYKGKTLVISTHDVETAYEWADDVIMMCEGGILFSGSVDELFEQEELLHKARLTRPLLYHLNVQRHLRTGEPEAPRPHTPPECCQVFFKSREHITPGTLCTVCVDDSAFDPGIIYKFKKHNRGAYGSAAKRASRDMKLDLHHYFNALEHGLTKTGRGEDYLLVTESPLLGLVRDKVERFARHGNSEIRLSMASEHAESSKRGIEKYGILVIGHGSSMPYNKDLVEKIAGMVAESLPGTAVRVGFMCRNEPTLKEALQSLRNSGVSGIVVLPMFLEKGVHVVEDIPGLLGLKDGRKDGACDGIKVIYADPLGADDLIAKLARKRIDEACEPRGIVLPGYRAFY